jgi:hypothetical protein
MSSKLAGVKFIDAVFYAVSFFGLYSTALFMWSEVHNQGTEKSVKSQADKRGGRVEELAISVHQWQP